LGNLLKKGIYINIGMEEERSWMSRGVTCLFVPVKDNQPDCPQLQTNMEEGSCSHLNWRHRESCIFYGWRQTQMYCLWNATT